MRVPANIQDRVARVGPWFVLLVAMVFCAEALGYAACTATRLLPPHIAAWGALAVVALLVGAAATVLLDWLLLDSYWQALKEAEGLRRHVAMRQDLEAALASRIEQQRRLRHDIRGLLSPVLLTADRLLNHADPAVKRCGEIMVRTVDRATILLNDTTDTAANLPGDR